MGSISRRRTYSLFGPSSSPLYYTTLSRLPTRLVFAGLTRDSMCNLVVTSTELEAPIQRCLQARVINGVCTWPLAAMPSYREMLCIWRIEEQESKEQESEAQKREEQEITTQVSGRQRNAKNVPVSATQAPPPRECRFRILTADNTDRLRSGQHRLMQIHDDNIASSANALLMAEFGLYHEALLVMETYLKSRLEHSNLLLARTVQTLIYKQMLRQIEQEQKTHSVSIVPLAWYNTWTVNRERYHRELSIALMKGQCPRRCLKEVAPLS